MTNNNICFKPAASLLSDAGGGSGCNLRPNRAPEGEEMLLTSEQQGKFRGQVSAAVRHGGPPAESGQENRFGLFMSVKKRNLLVLSDFRQHKYEFYLRRLF